MSLLDFIAYRDGQNKDKNRWLKGRYVMRRAIESLRPYMDVREVDEVLQVMYSTERRLTARIDKKPQRKTT